MGGAGGLRNAGPAHAQGGAGRTHAQPLSVESRARASCTPGCRPGGRPGRPASRTPHVRTWGLGCGLAGLCSRALGLPLLNRRPHPPAPPQQHLDGPRPAAGAYGEATGLSASRLGSLRASFLVCLSADARAAPTTLVATSFFPARPGPTTRLAPPAAKAQRPTGRGRVQGRRGRRVLRGGACVCRRKRKGRQCVRASVQSQQHLGPRAPQRCASRAPRAVPAPRLGREAPGWRGACRDMRVASRRSARLRARAASLASSALMARPRRRSTRRS